MKTSSAKAKGRRLQQWVAERIRFWFNAQPEDVRSTSMGAQGVDVQMSSAILKKFPFAVECKNVEKVNIWSAWSQATANAPPSLEPLLIIKRNGVQPLVIMDAEYFIKYWSKHERES